jgi:hypothetical protein
MIKNKKLDILAARNVSALKQFTSSILIRSLKYHREHRQSPKFLLKWNSQRTQYLADTKIFRWFQSLLSVVSNSIGQHSRTHTHTHRVGKRLLPQARERKRYWTRPRAVRPPRPQQYGSSICCTRYEGKREALYTNLQVCTNYVSKNSR